MPFKPIAAREKIFLIFISFCLSLMLWLQVSAQAEPNKQREFLIRLETRGLNPELFAANVPDGITVIAEGPEQSLERLEPEELVATASLANLKVGDHSVRVRVPELRPPLRLRAKRSTVSVTLDKLVSTTKSVVVEVQGQIPGNLRFEGATSDPPIVTISGPAKEIARVRKVRAMLDLSLVRPGLVHQIDLELLGADNTPLNRVEANPRLVNVLPAVAAAPASKSVPISPTWEGTLPFPFRIKSYTVEPNTVQLTGGSGDLAQVYSVVTEPIKLGNIRATKTLMVRLKVPAGLTPLSDVEVKVMIEVERSTR